MSDDTQTPEAPAPKRRGRPPKHRTEADAPLAAPDAPPAPPTAPDSPPPADLAEALALGHVQVTLA